MWELKEILLARYYPERLIDSALDKARAVPRHKALMKGMKRRQQKNPWPVFALKYDPRHWKSMSNDMKEVFPQPPITAYRRHKNLRDFLIRAKVSEPKRLQRHTRGMSKCGKAFTACPYIQERKNIRNKENSYWEINRSTNCQSSNVIYMIECNAVKTDAMKNTLEKHIEFLNTD